MKNDKHAHGLDLDRDRMRCSHYYDRVWKLLDTGALKGKQVKKIVKTDQIKFFIEDIEPLEEALNKNYDRDAFDGFRKLYKKELGTDKTKSDSNNID